jgi:DNA polymerase V
MTTKTPKRSEILEVFIADTQSELHIPFVEAGISAGFPSPALDFAQNRIDLNKELIKNPTSTFYGKVKGDSMTKAGIDNGDLLVIDRSIEPSNNKIAVCYIDGEFTVKRIQFNKKECWLIAENDNYKPIRVTEENELIIWGIVVHLVKTF